MQSQGNHRVQGKAITVNVLHLLFLLSFQEQVIKFANYLLTRKHVQSVKDTTALLYALDKLGNNPVSDNFHSAMKFKVEILYYNLSTGKHSTCLL